jgi:hypothetical protein
MVVVNVQFLVLAFSALTYAQVKQPSSIHETKRSSIARADTLEERDSVPAGYVASPYYPTPKGGVSILDLHISLSEASCLLDRFCCCIVDGEVAYVTAKC